MYLSCDTKKFHDNENTHILHNFWTSTHRGEASTGHIAKNSPTFKNYGTFLWNLVPRDAVPAKRIDESSWFFCRVGFFRPVLHCVMKKFGYLQNEGTSLWNFLPNSELRHDKTVLSVSRPLRRRELHGFPTTHGCRRQKI